MSIDIPEELTELLKKYNLKEAFDSLSFTKRKEMARGISSAKREDTIHKRLRAALIQLQKVI
ncbi:MAG: YdeI/OmpD-associated family protein [Flavobacteriales bacterium]